MAFPVWVVNLIKKTFPSIFTVARATHIPVVGRIIDRALFEGDHMVYLPRDRVIDVKEAVEGPGEMVLPSQVVEHFIGEANFLWIMKDCICRDAMHCRNYPIELGCLFLGEAAMGINPELGRRVSREEALDHVRLCREAGLVHLVGRNKLDTVWLNVRPGNKLLTVCHCCPCCCIWRTLPYLEPGIGDKIRRMPGVKVTVTDRCTGCGDCVLEKVCFVNALRLEGGRAVISDACRGCGRCVSMCPEGAIEISINQELFVKDSIEKLSELVDVK